MGKVARALRNARLGPRPLTHLAAGQIHTRGSTSSFATPKSRSACKRTSTVTTCIAQTGGVATTSPAGATAAYRTRVRSQSGTRQMHTCRSAAFAFSSPLNNSMFSTQKQKSGRSCCTANRQRSTRLDGVIQRGMLLTAHNNPSPTHPRTCCTGSVCGVAINPEVEAQAACSERQRRVHQQANPGSSHDL